VTAPEERAVIDAATEYYRCNGSAAAHNQLMDAVQKLERSPVSHAVRVSQACFCGTGREHVHGQGYYCKPSPTNAHYGTSGETT
jgi:hypothetical protein